MDALKGALGAGARPEGRWCVAVLQDGPRSRGRASARAITGRNPSTTFFSIPVEVESPLWNGGASGGEDQTRVSRRRDNLPSSSRSRGSQQLAGVRVDRRPLRGTTRAGIPCCAAGPRAAITNGVRRGHPLLQHPTRDLTPGAPHDHADPHQAMLSQRSHQVLFLTVIFWVMGCDPSLPDRVAGPRLPVSEEFAVAAATGTASITSNFNATPIRAGATVWFNAVFRVSGRPPAGTTIYFSK